MANIAPQGFHPRHHPPKPARLFVHAVEGQDGRSFGDLPGLAARNPRKGEETPRFAARVQVGCLDRVQLPSDFEFSHQADTSLMSVQEHAHRHHSVPTVRLSFRLRG